MLKNSETLWEWEEGEHLALLVFRLQLFRGGSHSIANVQLAGLGLRMKATTHWFVSGKAHVCPWLPKWVSLSFLHPIFLPGRTRKS